MGNRLTEGWPSLRDHLCRWVRRRPLLWAALISLLAVLVADGEKLWALPAFVLGLVAVWLGAGARWFFGVGLVALTIGGFHGVEVKQRRAARSALGEGLDAVRTVRIVEVPKSFGWNWVATVEDPANGQRMRLLARRPVHPKGSLIEVRGRLLPPGETRNPGEFDTFRWLDRSGVFALFDGNRGVRLIEEAPAPWSFGESVRSGFREAVTKGLDPLSREAAVIRAVVLGEHPNDDVLIEPFRRTGTLHVFAVSGLHVGMVGVLAWCFCQLAGVSRRASILPIILMMFGYAWLTGMKPPAVRAAWMAAVVLGAFWFRRRPDMANALGFAGLLVLLVDADLVFTAGVQLSFGVVLAIGLLHRSVSHLWRWIEREEPYLPRSLYGPVREGWLKLRRGACGMLTVSTSAWMGSAPLTAWHFGILTPIAVPASALLGLMVFPLLGIALVSSVLEPVPGLSSWLNQRNASLARWMLGTAELGAAVPGGHVVVPRDRPADDFLIVYDVESDGAACWFSGSSAALIDGAGKRHFERVVLPSMRRMDIRPRVVVATHPDGGHVGGLIEAMDAFPVEAGLAPVLRALGPTYRDWLQAAEIRDVPLRRGRSGVRYELGPDAWLEVLLEPDPWNWHQLADERVMPVRLHWRGWRILFMGDAGWSTESTMLRSGADLGADLIVAGRHGYDGSLGSRFLSATGAQAIIASHADFPTEEQVPERWMKATQASGINVLHQGQCGAVVVTVEDEALVLKGWIGGREVRLARSSRD